LWYSGSIIISSLINDKESGIVEENIVIVNAIDEKQAFELLSVKSQEYEIEYYNAAKEKIKNIIKGIFDIQQIISEEVVSGTEVFYRHFDINLLTKLNNKI
jgi:hypothetical protein